MVPVNTNEAPEPEFSKHFNICVTPTLFTVVTGPYQVQRITINGLLTFYVYYTSLLLTNIVKQIKILSNVGSGSLQYEQ